MKYQIVTVRDRTADVFGQPFFVARIGQAIRSFSDEVNSTSSDSAIAKHPEDFDLYELGTFDDETASFETFVPRQVAIGKDLKAK
jgi:hypothetical protein